MSKIKTNKSDNISFHNQITSKEIFSDEVLSNTLKRCKKTVITTILMFMF